MSEATICNPYDAAVDAVKRGWPVIPVHATTNKSPGRCTCGRPDCPHPGKHPAEVAWQKSSYLSTADCWSLFMEDSRRLNAGILTGIKSGIIVLDIDPRNGGEEGLIGLLETYGGMPDTYTVKTGSGGWHFYFQLPEGMDLASPKLGIDGVDFLANGRMAVTPGSVSGSGTYVVHRNVPLAMIPEWLVALAREKLGAKSTAEIIMAADLPTRSELSTPQQERCYRYAIKVIEMECEAYATAPWGQGNDRLFMACCNILEILQSPWSGVGVDYARARLEDARIKRKAAAQAAGNGNGASISEVDITWESARRRVAGKGRKLPEDAEDRWDGILFETPFVTGSAMVSGAPLATGSPIVSGIPFMQPSDAEAAAIDSLEGEGVQITEADRIQFAQAEVQAQWDALVLKKKFEMDVVDAAKKLQRAEHANRFPDPTATLLTDLLSEVDEGPQYRIGDLWPVGGRIILAAQFKAGKSTLIGNVIRSVIDGDAFLGRGVPFSVGGETSFPVSKLAPEEKVFLIDLELDRRTVRRWLCDQGIKGTDQVCVQPLRGRLAEFNILDEDRRTKWAALMREQNTRVLIIDPLAPLLNSLGLNEKNNEDVGPLLDALDTLCEEAGVSELLIAHHMGHNGDRSRGASRLRDWPDVEWKLIKEGSGAENGKEAKADAPRFFSAFGRDVLVQESRLDFDPETRRLFITGGDRGQHAATKGLPLVIEIVRGEPGISTNGLVEAMQRRGLSQVDARRAIKSAVTGRDIHTYPGTKRAILHFSDDQCTTPEKCASGVRLNFAAVEPTAEEIEHGLSTIEAVFADLFPGTTDGVSEGKVRMHAMDDTRKLSVSRAVFDRSWDEALEKGSVVQVGSAKVYRWDALATPSHH